MCFDDWECSWHKDRSMQIMCVWGEMHSHRDGWECELVLAFLFILYAVDLNVDLAQQFCWSGLFCLSSLQLHQIHHTLHIHFLHKPPNLNLFIWSREAKMFCWITNSLFIVKSRSAHWHTVRFSLSVCFQLYQRHIWK